jgi:hypothetical protein
MVTFPPNSKLMRIASKAFWKCSSLTSLAFPSSLTVIGERCFDECPALLNLTFVAPSQLRDLLDLPEHLAGLQEIPDSVERLRLGGISAHGCFRPVSFGRESRLVEVRKTDTQLTSANRCFLQVSSRSLKVFRSRMEFRKG